MKAVTSNDSRARIDRVLAHLAAHLDADLSVAELARIAHFSPYHFHRMFRAMTGESVAAVMRRPRLETAGRALRERDTSVTDVALAAGPLTEGAALPTSIPATPSLPRRAVGPVPAVVIGSSEGADDTGSDGARPIRRRLPQVLETRR